MPLLLIHWRTDVKRVSWREYSWIAVSNARSAQDFALYKVEMSTREREREAEYRGMFNFVSSKTDRNILGNFANFRLTALYPRRALQIERANQGASLRKTRDINVCSVPSAAIKKKPFSETTGKSISSLKHITKILSMQRYAWRFLARNPLYILLLYHVYNWLRHGDVCIYK